MFVLIYDLYISFNLLTRFNPFVRDNEMSFLDRRDFYNAFNKRTNSQFGKSFLPSLFLIDLIQKRTTSISTLKGILVQTCVLFKLDLIKMIYYPKFFPNKNQEIFHRIQDWFVTKLFKKHNWKQRHRWKEYPF
jgi:hypothetical protein